jgi:hypothetical protein
MAPASARGCDALAIVKVELARTLKMRATVRRATMQSLMFGTTVRRPAYRSRAPAVGIHDTRHRNRHPVRCTRSWRLCVGYPRSTGHVAGVHSADGMRAQRWLVATKHELLRVPRPLVSWRIGKLETIGAAWSRAGSGLARPWRDFVPLRLIL